MLGSLLSQHQLWELALNLRAARDGPVEVITEEPQGASSEGLVPILLPLWGDKTEQVCGSDIDFRT